MPPDAGAALYPTYILWAGSISQECEGVGNPDTVMKSEKEKLREFKLSWKLLEELPDTVKEEEKHWCLRRGKF